MLSTKQTKKKVCDGSQFVYLCLYPPNTKKWDKKLTNKKEDLHLADNHCWCPPIAQRDQRPTWRSSWCWLSRWTSQHWSPTWLSERRCDHIGHTPGTHSADCSNVFILIDHCWVWWVWWKRPLWQAKLLSCHDIHHPESTAVTFHHYHHQEILHGGDVGLATREKSKNLSASALSRPAESILFNSILMCADSGTFNFFIRPCLLLITLYCFIRRLEFYIYITIIMIRLWYWSW